MPDRYLIGGDKLRRTLRDLPRKQILFATAMGLTRTAQLAVRDFAKELPQTFDRPTPFTPRALGEQRATKAGQSSEVFIKRNQARYLGIQIKGGARKPIRQRTVTPASVRLNRYGNLTRNKMKTLLARPDHFSAEINGVEGIWQRRKCLDP